MRIKLHLAEGRKVREIEHSSGKIRSGPGSAGNAHPTLTSTIRANGK